MSYRGQNASFRIGDGATATPTVFYDVISGALKFEPRHDSDATPTHAVNRGAMTRARVLKQRAFTGSVTVPLEFEACALLKHCVGEVATTGAGPYTHTFRPASDGNPALFAAEFDYGDDIANSRICQSSRVASWSFGLTATERARLTVNLVGLASPSAATKTSLSPSGARTEVDANECTTLTLNSVNLLSGGLVQSLQFNVENGIQTKYGIGSASPAATFNNGTRTVTADMVVHVNAATYDDYRILHEAQTEVTLVATITNGSQTFTVTMNGALVTDPAEMNPTDNGLIAVPIKLVARQTTIADNLQIVVVNANSSAYAN